MQAGFNLTATAQRQDLRLISVVLGAPSNPQRFIQTSRLLEWGFSNYTKVHLINRGEALPVQVQVQAGPLVQPVANSDISLVLPKDQAANVKIEYSVPQVVEGPVTSGEALGKVIATNGGQVVAKVDAVAPPVIGAAPAAGGAAVAGAAPAAVNTIVGAAPAAIDTVVVGGASSIR
jgi:D-alanyl-D-alanine carboxypeptidase (penicillin-binding protein 5/6)